MSKETSKQSLTLRHARLKVQTMQLSKLKPHPRNPRHHPEPGSRDWEALKKSLKDVYFDPLVFNKANGFLVSGHLRAKVLEEMGCETVDCVVVNIDEKRHIAMLLRANNSTGDYEMAQVKELLKELEVASFDLDLTGFDATTLSDLNEIKDVVPMDIEKVKKDFSFTISCRTRAELEKLQSMLRVVGKKAQADRVIRVLQSYLDLARKNLKRAA